jgi:hypothetical protein
MDDKADSDDETTNDDEASSDDEAEKPPSERNSAESIDSDGKNKERPERSEHSHEEVIDSDSKEKKSDAVDSDKKSTRLSRLFDFVHKLSSFIVDAAIILLFFLIVAIFTHRFWSTSKVLEKIDVSKSAEDLGLSSLAVSERLADEIQNIQPAANDLANRRKLLEPAWESADIQVQGASVSLHSLIDLVKEEFWSNDRKLNGELDGSSGGKLRILIREVGTGNSFTTDFCDYSNFDKLIAEAAKDALRLIDPPTLASYYFSIHLRTITITPGPAL